MVDPVSLGLQLALTATSMALTAARKVEGPRLDNLKWTTGDYGAPLARVWGTCRLPEPAFWADDLKEVKKRRKTKGGKYNDYTYFGTWPSALACHEIAGVTRIWLDKHLVYDRTGAGPVTPFDLGEDAGTITDFLRFYLGTMTQEVDPAMQAAIEAKHGAGSCPAYLGTAYAMWDGLPLEKFGNRIPQAEYEVVSLSDPLYPWETYATVGPQANRLWGATFSPDYSRFMWAGSGYVEIWDVAARSLMIAGDLTTNINLHRKLGIYEDGSWLAVSSGNSTLYSFAADSLTGVAIASFVGVSNQQEDVRVLKDGAGVEHWATVPHSFLTRFYFDTDAAYLEMINLTGPDWAPGDWFVDLYGDVWAVGRIPGSSKTTAYFYRMVYVSGRDGPGFLTVTGLSSSSDVIPDTQAVHYRDDEEDHFVLAWENKNVYCVDINTGAVTHSTGDILDVYNAAKQFANCPPGASTIWLNSAEYSLKDLSLVRTVTLNNWKAEDADGIIYDPVNHALICFPQFDQLITWRFLDRLGGAGVTLRTIVEDVCELSGIAPATVDATALTQVVAGYSVTSGSGKDWLEPLLDLYDVDARPHGFQLQFVNRGGAAGATISHDAFAEPDGGAENGGAIYQSANDGATALPSAVSLQFLDKGADQQPNAALSGPRFSTASNRVSKIDMSSLVLAADEAKQLAGRVHRRGYFDRVPYAFALPSALLALEPADVRPLLLPDGLTVTARLVSMVLGADRRIVSEWRRDEPSAALLDGSDGAMFDGYTPQTITTAVLTKAFVLDIPLLRDVDESANVPLYVAAAPYGAGAWPGAVFYTGAGYSEEFASVESTARAAWGYATDVLPDAPTGVWDRGSVVNVMLQTGTLTGCTEAQIDTNRMLNLCLIGNELLNFTTATLQGDGSYDLSGFKRARQGTEQHCASHAARDVFLLLDTVDAVDAAVSDVGTNLTFKAPTNGRTLAGAFPVDLAPLTGASRKPLAPVHLRGLRNFSTNDWALTWVRRTRVGGAWTSGTAIPLSEASEEYELEVMNGAAVVRTVTGLSSASYSYTSAMQVTDFGSNQAAVTFRVYQISDAVDRGFVASATV